MNYTRSLRNSLRGAVLISVLAGFMAISHETTAAFSFDDGPGASIVETSGVPQAQEAEGRDPEANLPFLFAVFFITWGTFFGYIFVMSRRQREMQREIDALKMALTERERHEL